MTILIMSVIPVMACGQATSVALPDLIIESVTYSKAATLHDQYGMPILNPLGIDFDYTVNIKNIGKAPAVGLLYVYNTTSDEDLRENHYSGGQLVKYAEPVIEPGEVFTARYRDYKKGRDVKTVRFIVNPDRGADFTRTTEGNITYFTYTEHRRIEESNYKNNTCELEFK
ncbi:hypothetical protein ACFLVH_01835 [Chloroflexota bacterium]